MYAQSQYKVVNNQTGVPHNANMGNLQQFQRGTTISPQPKVTFSYKNTSPIRQRIPNSAYSPHV